MWEDLCFDAQQAAEKAVKAVLVRRGIRFPQVHDLSDLLRLAEDHAITVPPDVKRCISLTQYASLTRYPYGGESATEDEHRQAVASARTVVEWATAIIGPDADDGPPAGGKES